MQVPQTSMVSLFFDDLNWVLTVVTAPFQNVWTATGGVLSEVPDQKLILSGNTFPAPDS